MPGAYFLRDSAICNDKVDDDKKKTKHTLHRLFLSNIAKQKGIGKAFILFHLCWQAVMPDGPFLIQLNPVI